MAESCVREVTRRTRDVVKKSNRSSKLYSSVRVYRGSEEDHQIVNAIKSQAQKCLIKGVFRHNNHIHIIHDCALSNGTCRCWLFTHARRYIPRHTIRELQEEDWRDVFFYHLFNGFQREVLYLKIGDTEITSEISDQVRALRPTGSGLDGDTATGSMETCDTEDQILRKLGSRRAGDSESDPSDDEIYTLLTGEGKKKRRKLDKFTEKAEEIYKKLVDLCCAPLTDADRTLSWVDPNSKYKFDNDFNNAVKNAKNSLKIYFSKMTLAQFRDFYEKKQSPCLWGAPSLDRFYEHYFDLDTSIYKAMQLLIYQNYPDGLAENYEIREDTRDWEFPLWNYVRELISLLDRKAGKENTHYYISQSNAGKTTFFDMVRDYLLIHGNMSNWNRYSRFPMQMCVDVRVIFWNEPNCEPAAFEELKKVFGGEYYSADIKNRQHAEIPRTPIIVTGNYDFIKGHPNFASRVKYYYWMSAPFLAPNKGRRLHPMALQKLFEMCENYFEEKLLV